MGQVIAKIRTSDRIAFKRCRRKWGFSSSMRMNLTNEEAKAPLWMGTGFHYAMEDYHGYNEHKHPSDAFRAYVKAVQATPLARQPDNWEQLQDLAIAMCDYYVEWLRTRKQLETFWYNGKPQVEVQFEIPLPVPQEFLDKNGWDQVVYQGTLDRVVIDEHGRLWILDYKTAKSFATHHLDTDPQITTYCWAGTVLYPDMPITGFVYQQHKKDYPSEPEFLKSSKSFSTSKSQTTTHRLYKNALVNLYGDIKAAPSKNVEFLNFLAMSEDENMDAMIRRDWEFRNDHQIEAEGAKILLETMDMANKDLALYPNPTRDCSWDCDFKMACVMMDDGSDWEYELKHSTISRSDENDNWRKFI